MTKTMTRMIASVAALSLAATPIVAQAGTRAGDSTATYSATKSKPGVGRKADGEGAAAAGTVIILGGLAVTATVFVALLAAGVINDKGDCISPAGCLSVRT